MGVCGFKAFLSPSAAQAVKELQTSTREAIGLLKAMIEEVRNSADEEETAINSLFGSMQASPSGAGGTQGGQRLLLKGP